MIQAPTVVDAAVAAAVPGPAPSRHSRFYHLAKSNKVEVDIGVTAAGALAKVSATLAVVARGWKRQLRGEKNTLAAVV